MARSKDELWDSIDEELPEDEDNDREDDDWDAWADDYAESREMKYEDYAYLLGRA